MNKTWPVLMLIRSGSVGSIAPAVNGGLIVAKAGESFDNES